MNTGRRILAYKGFTAYTHMCLCTDDLNHKSEINVAVFRDVIPRVSIFCRSPLPPLVSVLS
jgi:hypothetical protein